jgi:hypothetical protein
VNDNNGKEVVLQGQEAVVTAEGATDEKLGKGSNLFGEGAKLANFTVYGPGGKDDIKHYRGFTMTSDFSKFGAITNGEFDVKFVLPGKAGPLNSNWEINGSDPVNCLYGINPSPISPYSETQKNGNYFHRSNNDGSAGTFYKNGRLHAISTGCILIVPSGHGENGWDEFNAQLHGVSSFHFVLNRTATIPYATFQRYPLPSERDLKNRNYSFIYDMQRKP